MMKNKQYLFSIDVAFLRLTNHNSSYYNVTNELYAVL